MNTSYVSACCSIVAQVGPTFAASDGSFKGAATRNGIGDYTLTLLDTEGTGAGECVCFVSPRAVIAASGAVSMGVNHTDATHKQVTIVQEAAAGGASIRADINFDFVLIQIPV